MSVSGGMLRVKTRWTGTLVMVVALGLSGCAPAPLAERLASDDPQVRVGAVYELQSVPGASTDVRLIHLLADEDASVRLFASTALAKRTGQRFDYLPAAPLADRAAAIARWIQWCETKYPETGEQFDDLEEWLKNFESDQKPATDAATGAAGAGR